MCSQLSEELADIPAEMRALYGKFHSQIHGGGWRRVGRVVGISGAYARQIAYEKKPVTRAVSLAWLLAMGWKPATAEVAVCPTCGDAHVPQTGIDCHGRPVVAVVALAPDEEVRKVSPRRGKRKPYWRPCLDPAQRRAGSRDEFLAYMADLWDRHHPSTNHPER